MQTKHEAGTAAIAILRGMVRSGMLRDRHLTQRMARDAIAAWDGAVAIDAIQSIRGEDTIERARRGHA